MTKTTRGQAQAAYPLLIATRRAGAAGLTMSDARRAMDKGPRMLAAAFQILEEHGFVIRRRAGGQTKWVAGPPVADEEELLWAITRRKVDHDV